MGIGLKEPIEEKVHLMILLIIREEGDKSLIVDQDLIQVREPMKIEDKEEEEEGKNQEEGLTSLMIGMSQIDMSIAEITKELAGDTLLMYLKMAIKKVTTLMMMIKKISKESLSQNITTVRALIADSTQIMLSAGKKMEIKTLRLMIQIKEKYSHLEYSLKIFI
jgi:hypothetical protein